VIIHLSGCRKGCAHPAPAAVTVVGTEIGCGIIRDGSARAVPHRVVALDALSAQRVSQLAAELAADIASLSALPKDANG
jgi:precorrin-3B synthase